MHTTQDLKLATLAELIGRALRNLVAAIARFFGAVNFSFRTDTDDHAQAQTIAQEGPAAVNGDARWRVIEAANQLVADAKPKLGLEIDDGDVEFVKLHRVDDLGDGRLRVQVMAAIGQRFPATLCSFEMRANPQGKVDRQAPQYVQDLLDTLSPGHRMVEWYRLCKAVEADLASQRLDLDNRVSRELRPTGQQRSIVQMRMDQLLVDRLQKPMPKRGPNHAR